MKSDALKLMKSFMIEFGLTAGSRTKLTTDESNATEGPADKYFNDSQGTVRKTIQ